VCHGADRQGRPGLYPPLAGSEWVSGPPEKLAAIILDGLQGPLGKYNTGAVMPGWRGYLKDAEIAGIMTWLRSQAGKPAVAPVEVSRVHFQTEGRNTFWNLADLQNMRIR
jgi:mono/diheme cytochrome c family protein